MTTPLACRVLGHRYRFTADGPTMTWTCQRGCNACGSKVYPSPADAARYAAPQDRPKPVAAHILSDVLQMASCSVTAR